MNKKMLRFAAAAAAVGCLVWIGLVSAPQGNAPQNKPQATLTTTDLIQGIEKIKAERARPAAPPPGKAAAAPASTAAPAGDAVNRARAEIAPWFNPNLGPGAGKALEEIATIYASQLAQKDAVKAIIDKKWNPAREQYDKAASDAAKTAAEARLRSVRNEIDQAGRGMLDNDRAIAASLDLAKKAGLLTPAGLEMAQRYYQENLRKVKYAGQ